MAHSPTQRAHLPPPPARVGNRFGWAALLAGVCGLTLFWVPYFFPAAGLTAIALGAIGYSKAQTGSATNPKVATVGIVLGVLSLVLPVIAIVGLGMYVSTRSM